MASHTRRRGALNAPMRTTLVSVGVEMCRVSGEVVVLGFVMQRRRRAISASGKGTSGTRRCSQGRPPLSPTPA
jgi:hypothetical protein